MRELPLRQYLWQFPDLFLLHGFYNQTKSPYKSPLSKEPIVAFGFCFFNFTARRLLRFLTELMKKDIGIVFVVKIQHSIISRTQFPDVILQMFGNIFP